MQSEDPRHGRRFRAPRAPQPQHEGGDRGEGMAVDLSKINRPARATAWAEYVEPRRPRDQRGPDRRRPQHAAARGQLLIPALDDGLRFGARVSIGTPMAGSIRPVRSASQARDHFPSDRDRPKAARRFGIAVPSLRHFSSALYTPVGGIGTSTWGRAWRRWGRATMTMNPGPKWRSRTF
jgi:hypothetical protein